MGRQRKRPRSRHRAVRRPGHQHDLLDRAVVLLEIVVGHRPIETDAVARPEFEISGHHAGSASRPALGIASEPGTGEPFLLRREVVEYLFRRDAAGVSIRELPCLLVAAAALEHEYTSRRVGTLEIAH